MSTTDTSGMSTEPFVWVIIPLVAVFSVGTFIVFIWNRQRRRQNPDRRAWPEDRVLVGSSYIRYRRGLRWSPWSETRSVEGLNELGEAPPPYDSKKPPALHNQHPTRREETGEEGSELRDLESGGRPPAYPAQPPLAVITDTRTS
ncbi:hypothetical protein VB005_00632 [Metarhizium brunneum]